MPRILFSCAGGHLALPDRGAVLVSREDGGNLLVSPPREVWERCELTPAELTQWSFLVAAAGEAMLRVLPQLEGCCINYWEAGNWALNVAAEPPGPKTARDHRRMHLHLLGRSRTAANPAWRWGEAPRFPDFAGRQAWAATHARLTSGECGNIVVETERLLRERYNVQGEHIAAWETCPGCAYPTVIAGKPENRCSECGDQHFGVCYLE